MRIRLKFRKTGPVKFVGHLDTMRLFQRAVKVASVPVAYSQGFSPHSLVYFALPLGVGVQSTGDYMEIVTATDIDPTIVKDNLNAVLVEGVRIEDAFKVGDKSDSLMSLVQAADYDVRIAKTEGVTLQLIERKLQAEELIVMKKGKAGIRPLDLKPMLLECNVSEEPDSILISMYVLAGSSSNLNPDLFVQALLEGEVAEIEKQVTRKEMYTADGDTFIPLDTFGREQ
ncbi:TIGR03936 family radical SAM-associated protein [Cellulosilyticum ruminicola]|uniref:TIGR03936 family radical SAM-associated protein n=1 Tax=Cellulosilyticum ruminicola TaxID=425254 RepID=UPI0006D21911|nr:TIGR03936 family radical SAM-associated protein [Cellulosilyticum ruminicola]